jgi:Fur family transcriptional regulator, ferric uptake regulator
MGDSGASIGRAAFGNGRVSVQRAAIARAARDCRTAFTADELLAAVRRELPGVGIATVYRAVAAMEGEGFIEPVGARGGAALFVQCGQEEHHHHVVCTGCGAVASAECSLGAATCADGFAITGHELSLYGLCPRCQR